MHWLAIVFVIAVALETATRLWLSSRQITAQPPFNSDDPM
jgi:hypothetical protein